MERLDNYTELPSGMKDYLSNYGWHFSKKMYEFAVSNMTDRNNSRLRTMSKDEIDTILKNSGVSIKYKGYDGPYVFMMAKSDFLGSSILNDQLLAKFVKDYIEDKDGYDDVSFTRFYADCIAKGSVIIWEDML